MGTVIAVVALVLLAVPVLAALTVLVALAIVATADALREKKGDQLWRTC